MTLSSGAALQELEAHSPLFADGDPDQIRKALAADVELADLTLHPPDPKSGPPPLSLCHPCSKRFLKMLEPGRKDPESKGA
jgi:hypothetical protein